MKNRRPVWIIAEDDHEDWMLMEELFTENNLPIQIERVPTAEALLKRLKSKGPPPDLVLLDYKLPDKPLDELVSLFENDPKLHKIPIRIMVLQLSAVLPHVVEKVGCIPKPMTANAMRQLSSLVSV